MAKMVASAGALPRRWRHVKGLSCQWLPHERTGQQHSTKSCPHTFTAFFMACVALRPGLSWIVSCSGRRAAHRAGIHTERRSLPARRRAVCGMHIPTALAPGSRRRGPYKALCMRAGLVPLVPMCDEYQCDRYLDVDQDEREGEGEDDGPEGVELAKHLLAGRPRPPVHGAVRVALGDGEPKGNEAVPKRHQRSCGQQTRAAAKWARGGRPMRMRLAGATCHAGACRCADR